MLWLKELLGFSNSTFITELSDDSDDDSDFEYSLEARPDKKVNRNANSNLLNSNSTNNLFSDEVVVPNREMNEVTTDASPHSLPKPELALRLEGTFEIEQNLDDYEMVSLVYLLYEDRNFALQELILFLQGAEKNLLYTWANLEQTHSNPWQNKLIEALCVIKNYQILRTLGYKKHELIMNYLPHLPNAVTSLNIMRKAIYLICEKLNSEKTDKFLETIKSNFQERGIFFTEYSREYLELYFLDWEVSGYISMTDLSNIKRTLKVMDDDILRDDLEKVFNTLQAGDAKKVTENIQTASSFKKTEETMQKRMPSTSTDTHQLVPCSRQESSESSLPSIGQDNGPNFNEDSVDSHKYKIDPENPGHLLIINQEEFYTEVEEEFLDLLPEDIEINKLDSRKGTEKDKLNLANTFMKFGFRVSIVENLTHEELIAEVTKVVRNIRNESSLLICILSHGEKGVVYGANSCKVKVNRIQEIMCRTNKENLAGKPKILILQSCQGKWCERLNEYSDDENEYGSYGITTDRPGSSKPAVPRTVDMLTFWATVPGYAAIRNKKTGSWFIQALCNKVTELGNRCHFAEICTRILNDVSSRKWIVEQDEINVMTPLIVSTLRKDFYLPQLRSN